MHQGSCLCGKISFIVEGELKAPDACHCTQCRKFSGHFFVATDIPMKKLTIQGEENITWFQQTEKVRRGFCSTCGSSLFFEPLDKNKHDWMGIAMGSFDAPTKTKLGIHIFVAEKGDYYEIKDGLPQNQH